MNKELIKTLTPALRQYRKQTEDEFVGAYDYDVSNQIVSELESELQLLRAEKSEIENGAVEDFVNFMLNKWQYDLRHQYSQWISSRKDSNNE